jgi:cytochrome P450
MNPTVDELTSDPHAVWDALRSRGAIVWVEALGAWVTLSREAAIAVMRDATTFTVDDPRFATAQVVGPSMLSLDGDVHAHHRGPFAHSLRPGDVARDYDPWMREAAAALVASLASPSELRTQLAGPWSVAVMARVLGLDPTNVNGAQLLGWYRSIVAATEAAAVGQTVPQDGLDAMASLASAVGIAAFVGPNTLTEAMIANLLWHLLANDQWARVRDQRELLAPAIEESLRLEPAATRVDRYATVDTEISGCRIAAGEFVIVSLAAAGRDPSVFTDPHTFDIDRSNTNRHLAFATGPHTCIGLHLARAETTRIISALMDRHPSIEMIDRATDPPSGLVFRKPQRLTVTWRLNQRH